MVENYNGDHNEDSDDGDDDDDDHGNLEDHDHKNPMLVKNLMIKKSDAGKISDDKKNPMIIKLSCCTRCQQLCWLRLGFSSPSTIILLPGLLPGDDDGDDDVGLEAHSHHDKFPPWWVFVRDDYGGNLSVTKSHH